MSRKAFLSIIITSFLLCSCTENHVDKIEPVIDTSRLIIITIDDNNNVHTLNVSKNNLKHICDQLNNHTFTPYNVILYILTLDVYEDSIKNILKELKKNNFKLYNIGCYNPRKVTNKKSISLHAYASAIDINTKQNPYIDVYKNIIIPAPDKNQVLTNKDGYLNRNKVRPGMITEKEAQIFYKNGFTQWGGSTIWRGCPDYMHFQVSLAIAKIVTTLPKEEAKIFWSKYLQNPQKIILDPFFNQDINEKEIKLKPLLKRIDNILKK
ncbi:MAG: M15 family metallopeptidase [Alphaproteobacteria bacterium]|nr:M15 family metallopeptidase [Alphaproteobacteria bacterium]